MNIFIDIFVIVCVRASIYRMLGIVFGLVDFANEVTKPVAISQRAVKLSSSKRDERTRYVLVVKIIHRHCV